MILWSVIFYRHIFCGSQITAVKCGCCNGLGVHKRNGSDLARCRIGAFTVGEVSGTVADAEIIISRSI